MTINNQSFHRRKHDDMEHSHERASDQTLLDMLVTLKDNNSKIESIASDVTDVKRSNEAVKDRLNRLEISQEALSKQLKETSEYVKKHAKEEEEILQSHVKKMSEFQENIEKIKRGFPKNDDGERDPRSHADNHEVEQEKKKEYSNLLKDIKKWAVIATLGAFASGAFYLLVTGTKVELTRTVQTAKP